MPMQMLIGASSGVFSAVSGKPAAGVDGRNVRHLARSGDVLYAAASDGVYRSADGGSSWMRIGIDAGEVWYVLPSPHAPNTVYAGTQPPHLFASHDSGDSWQEVTTFLEAPGAQRWCLPNSPAGARTLALAFDPNDQQHMWVGVEVGGVVSTRDGGRTWSVAVPCANADVHLLMPHPQRRDVLFATTGYGRNDDQPMDPRLAGPYRSDDGGTTWQYLGGDMQPHYTRPMCVDPRPPFPLTIPAVPDVRSSITDPGGAGSVLFRSDDDGQTWRSLGDAEHSPSPARFTAVTNDPTDLGWVLVGTETGEIWRVSPTCAWTQLAQGLPPVQTLVAMA